MSKVLGGRTDSVTLDKLIDWLTALGQSVEVTVTSSIAQGQNGSGAVRAGSVEAPTPTADVIYLDHHATTPVDPRVIGTIQRVLERDFGNPSSADHLYGESASAVVEYARTKVADLVGAHAEDVRFTAGATDALRLALAHCAAVSTVPLRVALTRVEHPALIELVELSARQKAMEILWIEVSSNGELVESTIEGALDAGAELVCVMAANNEVGTIYPIASIAERVHSRGAAILVDATQAAGRIEIKTRESGFDYLILSAHKLYGPKGVGALVAPGINEADSKAVLGHMGTLNVAGIAGFGRACELRRTEMAEDEARITVLRDLLEHRLSSALPDLVVNGSRHSRLSNNLHVSVPGVPNRAVVARLRRQVALSTGAACASGSDAPSHVLRAMNLSEDLMDGALRIGLGKFNTAADVEQAAIEIVGAIRAVRRAMSEETA